MKDFKKYWDKKAQKRRKSWEGKLARKLGSHSEIEEIREDVFKPFNRIPNFDDFWELAESHYTTKNPLAEWRGGKFCFSEVGLRDALLQYGGNLNEFTATREHSVCERRHFTDLDTFTFTYGAATMIIKRFSTKGVPFSYYEITPCTRFDDNCPMRMEETGFYTLDIATLLMEMDAECNLREEEFLYYTKGLRLARIEGSVAKDIEFKLWDDTIIFEKVKSLVNRYNYRYDVDPVLTSAMKPCMKAVQEFMEKITAADKDQEKLVFSAFVRDNWGSFVTSPEDYVKTVFRHYLDTQGLQEAKVYVHELGKVLIVIEFQGCKLLLKASSPYAQSKYQCYFYPYAEETDSFFNDRYGVQDIYHINFKMLTLSAIAKYVKLMPKYKDTIDSLKAKVTEAFQTITGK